MIGNLAKIEIEVIAMNVEGISIVGAEIVIGIMIMTENMKEIENVPEVMIQGVAEDLDPGQMNVREITIATGFTLISYILFGLLPLICMCIQHICGTRDSCVS